jgi:hypothetical protein
VGFSCPAVTYYVPLASKKITPDSFFILTGVIT